MFYKIEPTPIHLLQTKINENKIYLKRDDLIPLCHGGNKVRKATLFFDDLINKKNDCVVTYGSSSSNHCRVIANMATMLNIRCIIITPKDSTQKTSNQKIIEILNADIIECELEEVSSTIEGCLSSLRDSGYNPYFIEGGGHGNIGTEAYIHAYNEIKDYEEENQIHFDKIFLTSGTGSTQAGLICGSIICDDNRDIVGISNARNKIRGKKAVYESVKNYLKGSVPLKVINKKEITFIDDYILNGYGSFNEEIIQIRNYILRKEGVPLDLIYTGKAFWGMKRYLDEKKITDSNILFIHTGGSPLFYDNLGVTINE